MNYLLNKYNSYNFQKKKSFKKNHSIYKINMMRLIKKHVLIFPITSNSQHCVINIDA